MSNYLCDEQRYCYKCGFLYTSTNLKYYFNNYLKYYLPYAAGRSLIYSIHDFIRFNEELDIICMYIFYQKKLSYTNYILCGETLKLPCLYILNFVYSLNPISSIAMDSYLTYKLLEKGCSVAKKSIMKIVNSEIFPLGVFVISSFILYHHWEKRTYLCFELKKKIFPQPDNNSVVGEFIEEEYQDHTLGDTNNSDSDGSNTSEVASSYQHIDENL